MSQAEGRQASYPRRRLFAPGRSLTRRLIWLASAWIALALLLTGWVLTTQFRESGLNRLGDVLGVTIDEVVAVSQASPRGVVAPQIQDARTLRLASGKYWAIAEFTPEGSLRELARSRSLWDGAIPVPPELPARLRQAGGTPITYNAVGAARDDERLRVAAAVKRLPGRTEPLVFFAAIDRSAIDEDTAAFARTTWIALALLGAGLVTAVFLQVQVGLRPLFDLRNAIADVRKGKASRIERSYPVEIQPLADQVNRLLAHNQDVVERQRTHVGNLAHALKTPLSVMLAEAGDQPGLLPDVVRRQAVLMQGQVDHHLRRARAAARAQGLGERTPVDEVLDELAVMLERVFEARGVEIDWRAPDGLCFLGERQDLQEILGNLIENACKYGRRRVRISAGPTGLGMMVVVVEDDGPGLPPERYDQVLKRGARLDEEQPGAGLGLSIVDDLTKAYGGRLSLGASDMGGLKVLLDLPAAEA